MADVDHAVQTGEITWDTVDELLHNQFDGFLRHCYGRWRSWLVPMPAPPGGTLSVEIALRPRWSTVAIDRIRTTDRPASARAWLKANVWPVVRAACAARGGSGILPSGRTWAQATPIPRELVLEVLVPWLTLELTSWSALHVH